MMIRRAFLDCLNGQIHIRTARPEVVEAGKRAIICLHMMPKSGRIFAKLMPAMAGQRMVVAPDYPGYGESDCYVTNSSPSMADYAASVMEVIRGLDQKQVDLVGYHTGSMIAAMLADKYPEMIGKVVSISAPLFTHTEVKQLSQYFAPIPLDEAGTRFSEMWKRVLKYRGPGMTLEMAAVSIAENMRGGERYEDGHRAAFEYADEYAETLARLRQPILIINPGDDLYENSKRVDALISHADRIDCPEWGHGFLDLWPQQVAALILNFLDK